MPTTDQVQETPLKTFYSMAAHYAACINPGKAVLEGGVKAVFGEKHIEFCPAAGPDKKTYGVISTDDPEKIAWVEKQIASGNRDLMTIEQFMELTIPAEDKVKLLRQQQEETRRELTMKNKILEDLANTNPQLYAQLTKGAKGK